MPQVAQSRFVLGESFSRFSIWARPGGQGLEAELPLSAATAENLPPDAAHGGYAVTHLAVPYVPAARRRCAGCGRKHWNASPPPQTGLAVPPVLCAAGTASGPRARPRGVSVIRLFALKDLGS
jgi:hypothetical protein